MRSPQNLFLCQEQDSLLLTDAYCIDEVGSKRVAPAVCHSTVQAFGALEGCTTPESPQTSIMECYCVLRLLGTQTMLQKAFGLSSTCFQV